MAVPPEGIAKGVSPIGYAPVMLIRQAFRYELAPTPAQWEALANHAGAARWAWNWGLSVRRKAWKRRSQKMTAIELHRLLNRLKRTPRYRWLYEVSKCAPQEALRDLDRAYVNFWRGHKTGRRVGFPKFKKRGRCPERFRLTGAIRVENGVVVLPRIGRVATKESTGKFRGRILSATCRREADRWYCSLTVEGERADPVPISGPVVGVDLGVTTFATCSDGTQIESPRALAHSLRKLRRRSRAVSRKQRGSKNRAKAVLALARCHRHIRNQRNDALHKATTALAKAKSVIVVEDLHVAGMVQNRRCELAIDRDLNAARNLAQLGDDGLVAGSSPETENACGTGSAGQTGNGLVELPVVKQEQTRVHSHALTNA